MSTRKRSRQPDDGVEYILTSTKSSKTKDTTHTVSDTDDEVCIQNEQAADSSGTTVNMNKNNLAANSMESSSTDSGENNSGEADDLFLELSTEEVLRSTDVLIAEIEEFRRDMNADAESNSDDTIILTDVNHRNSSAERVGDASTSTQQPATTSTSANHSGSNNANDDSVVLIEDANVSTIRPIVRSDDDVIFVNESRREQRFRTIATIDLCDMPDTSFAHPNKATDQAAGAAAPAAASSAPPQQESPVRPGTIKCPICLDSYGFDEIMSTMCGHLFCGPCIRDTIKTRKKCPMCNRAMKPTQIHRIFLGT